MGPDELKKDFSPLRDTLEKLHAGLYVYRTKDQIDHVFDSCAALLNDSMDIGRFYGLIRFVIASIEDGHSNCSLPPEIMNYLFSNSKFFPAMVLFIHERAFILCCRQNDSLAESELLSINGHPMHEIILRMFNYIQSDGGIISRKNWELPENFQLLYTMLYGVNNEFNIEYKTKSGNLQSTVVRSDQIKNIICANPFQRPDRYLKLEYKPGNVALLTIKTFFDGFLQQTNENFKGFLDSAFRDIREKRPASLIIDIRSNQGGNDGNGIMLYSYLTSKPFRYYLSQQTTKEKFSEKDHPDLQMQQPDSNSYAGKLFVLANGRSFSASAEFSAIVKSNNRGLFIGEECGGGYYCNTSGDEDHVVLHYSKIVVRVPKIRYIMAVKKNVQKSNGIIPDFIFYPSISDLAGKTDSQLQYALKNAVSKK